MISLVWLILSLCGVVSFSWLVVLIDAVLVFIFSGSRYNEAEDHLVTDIFLNIAMGIGCFAFLKFFFDLSVSAWWLIISPVAMVLMFAVPGGFTIVNLLLKHFGLMKLPVWGLIVGIVLDIVSLVIMIYLIYTTHQERKMEKDEEYRRKVIYKKAEKEYNRLIGKK